ncbi:hypothetical protein [Rosenbergiella nectarea]|uniref:hypothetical protein n=1 Tax=Rosenbergiella nectarea TaxID=988801 RepID=UPI001BDB2020|nr:hypothetical protein [Rosenbergiella nectarea]MBT0728583.1 hypothetical protein [Rosenbergiella nectarea subsp. apis]
MAGRSLTALLLFLGSCSYADTGLNQKAGMIHILGQFNSATCNVDAVYQHPKIQLPLSTLFNIEPSKVSESPQVVNFFLPVITCPLPFSVDKGISITFVSGELSEKNNGSPEALKNYKKQFLSPTNIKLFSYDSSADASGLNMLLFVPSKASDKNSNFSFVLNFIYP